MKNAMVLKIHNTTGGSAQTEKRGGPQDGREFRRHKSHEIFKGDKCDSLRAHPMSPGGGVEGVGADLDVGAEDDRDDVQELAVRRLLRQPANETKRKDDYWIITQNKVNRCQLQKKTGIRERGMVGTRFTRH